MKISSSNRNSLLLLAIMAIMPQLSTAQFQDIQISQLIQEMEQNYLYCGKDRSKLSDLINQLSAFDQDKNSPVWLLRSHLDLGHVTATADSILEVLEYAERKLDQLYTHIAPDQLEEMYANLHSVVDTIQSGLLNIDDQAVAQLQKRSCGSMPDSDTIKVRQKLYVLRSAKFFKDVEFKDAVAMEGDLSVAGTLSVVSQNVGGVPFISNAGVQNSFVGANAGNATMIGTNNSAFGFNALIANGGGSSNTAVGSQALLANVAGGGNTAIGTNAGLVNTAGTFNTIVGAGALQANTTGSSNTSVGFGAMSSNISGSANVALGISAGNTLVSGNNNIYISHVGGGAAENGAIRLGTLGLQTAAFMQGIFGSAVAVGGLPVEVDAVGKLGTVVSSAEFKKNIQDMDLQSNKLRQLRPVTFQYKSDDSNTQQMGLIAEEVAQIFPELVVYDLEGKPYSVRYQVLPVLLLQELQKHQDSIDMLIDRVSHLEDVINAA